MFTFILGEMVTPALAQNNEASPGFDPSVLEIRPVARTTPRPITSLDLLTLRDLKGVRISPDGRSIAYVVSQAVLETNGYRTALFVVNIDPGSVPINLGSAGPPRSDATGSYSISPPEWSPDSKYITKLLKKNGTWQVWRWHREGGRPEQLTYNAQDVQNHEWTPDGSKIVFTVIEPIDANQVRAISEQGILYDGLVPAWKNKSILQVEIEKRPRRTQTWVFDVITRKERKATAEEEKLYKTKQTPPSEHPRAISIKLSPDGKSIAYSAQQNDPEKDSHLRFAIFVKNLSGGQPIQITPNPAGFILELWWSDDGSQIFFLQSIGDGRTTLFAVPARGGAIREVIRSEGRLSSVSFDKQRSRIACVLENATTPPELTVFDLKDGVPRTITSINPELINIKLSPATKLEWTNSYGDKTFGYLVKPLNYILGKRYPLVVTTYTAGGFLRGAVGDEYPIQVFAANGFAVLAFDEGDSAIGKPNDFESQMRRWRSPMESLKLALNTLESRGIVDANRKGLTGLSYGAEITEFTISHSDLFEAAAIGGPSGKDPFFYYLATKQWEDLFASWGLGWPEGEKAARWRELSPALNVERVKVPLLIQAAESEYLGSLQFYKALRAMDRPVEMFIYPNELHIKTQPAHKYHVYQRNVDWFNFWLQGREDPDPDKREQYVRWRAMRDALKRNQPATIRRAHPDR